MAIQGSCKYQEQLKSEMMFFYVGPSVMYQSVLTSYQQQEREERGKVQRELSALAYRTHSPAN